MSDPVWICVRQRAGPLVKECRALRPRLLRSDTAEERRDKMQIIRSPHSAVCRTRVDRLELRLALFGYRGSHYTLTFSDEYLPPSFAVCRNRLRAFLARVKRWKGDRCVDYIYCIEGRHGDHRYHIHVVFRDEDLSPAEVRYLWRYGEVVDEPVLLKEGGFRRLAVYFNKEASDGFIIPMGRHPWSCSRGLAQQLPPPERWTDASGVIPVPDAVLWARRGSLDNDCGAYYYASYILAKRHSALNLE